MIAVKNILGAIRSRLAKALTTNARQLRETNARFDAALANMTTGLSLFDADGNLVVWNSRYIEMYGLPSELIQPGVNITTIVEYRKRAGNMDLDVEAHVSGFRRELIDAGTGELSLQLGDGRTISVANGAIIGGGWVGIHEDITERLARDHELANRAAELARTNMRFFAALSNMTQGLCMFDANKRLVIANSRFREIYNLPAHLITAGTPLQHILQHLDDGKGDATSDRYLETHPTMLNRDYLSVRGHEISIKRSSTPDGGWVATHEDVTERRRAEAEVVHLARHDVLTGLVNRSEFNGKLKDASDDLKMYARGFTLMMLDLDEFKAVNDTRGHPAGDLLLIEVGRRLHSTIRETDVLARLGGDEFAIIQAGGPNQAEGAVALASRIVSVITQPFDLGGRQAHIGISIGLALAPLHGDEPEELLQRADLALYNAKANGRSHFQLFRPEMLDVAQAKQSAEYELRLAVDRNEFELHYQPIIDGTSRFIYGVEALLRWRHPTKGLVAPDEFIPLAESTGLIVELGEWIIQQACTDAASWPEHVKVAINLSAVQFKDGNLFDVILCTLVASGLSPGRVELEITETSLIENPEEYRTTIRQLKNLGIAVVLDDFGTGYSSVNSLISVPFDRVKIDKSFTQGVLHRRECKAVVASTLVLAQGLGILTTAEGIETEEQFEYMREAGVGLMQGYLFGRPVPIGQLDLHNLSLKNGGATSQNRRVNADAQAR